MTTAPPTGPVAPLTGLLTKAPAQARLAVELLSRPLGEWGIPLLGAGPHSFLVYGTAIPMLALTMFGADLVRRASLVMSVLILVCALSIFIAGIAAKSGEIAAIAAEAPWLAQGDDARFMSDLALRVQG